jgi:hypothetical protein
MHDRLILTAYDHRLLDIVVEKAFNELRLSNVGVIVGKQD